MREPKRLAHRQAERNKARVLKQWSWDEDDLIEPFDAAESVVGLDADSSLAAASAIRYQL